MEAERIRQSYDFTAAPYLLMKGYKNSVYTKGCDTASLFTHMSGEISPNHSAHNFRELYKKKKRNHRSKKS